MAYKSKKSIKYFIPAVILVGAFFYFLSNKDRADVEEIEIKKQETANNSNNVIPEEKDDAPQIIINEEIKQEDKGKIPDKILIRVPFTSQAPFSVWDKKHEEACEEASLVMIKYYLDNVRNAHVRSLTKDIAEKEIQDMIKFEIKKYGDYKDTTAAETARLAEDYYGIKNLKVVYDFKPDDIKKYLAQGKPIIVPAAGRELENPNFTPPGPLYHNLVLVGYSGSAIITNDPGTRKGEGYKYDINTLYGAIHDFPGKPEEIVSGRKAMIILE